MIKYSFLLFCLVAFIIRPSLAQEKAYSYQFTVTNKAIFDNILRLELTAAQEAIALQKKEDPKNLLVHYLADYIDFYKAFVDGTPDQIFGHYKTTLQHRIELLQQGSSNDPYYYYLQGDMYLRWGMIYALYGQNIVASKYTKRATTL